MDQILGHDEAIASLREALRSGRLPHAWIFSGPRGVGKCTTAIAFATILLDPDATPNAAGDLVSDPASETARLIGAGTHPDLHLIRKELALFSENPDLRNRKLRNVPLDLLRERMIGGRTSDDRQHDAPAYRTPSLGHGKVFIIDEAELIDPTGQNALLKTLEEPPRDTYIILVTSRPEWLLPTIRSRCRLLRFGPLDGSAMDAWFRRSLPEVSGAPRAWIERFAEGSPGLAAVAAEYGFTGWQETLDPMLERLEQGEFPVGMGQTLAGLVDAFAEAWVKNHTNASKDSANKDGARYLLSLLASHARHRLAASVERGADIAAWLRIIQQIRDAETQIESNVNQKIVLENLVAQWAAGQEQRGRVSSS